MQARQSQGIRYGVQVGAVLSAVVGLLLMGWHACAQECTVGNQTTDTALLALGLALIVGLRAMARVDHSLS